ncbi:GTP cyclohydrolase I [Niveomyces insectorum RCEF 264]|uniref:GTP cyclohydrolase 1 n=1 Tax=Niveomyces insectorum RCEF 264 TaxID=1081102 RepID=A0A167NFE2_9HYPO|nr:GTP cyclohydrolase I [Niveomyces insectorum RCEF 264]
MAEFERSETGELHKRGPDTLSNGKKRQRLDDGPTKSRKRKHKLRASRHDGKSKRRPSISKAARDPRDEPESSPTRSPSPIKSPATRSPSPVIDFDGLSRPSSGTRKRLEETEDQAEARLKKMSNAVRTILECVGEDPERSGLLDTPRRYAKALLDFTGGYQKNVRDIVNNAIFHEGHNEMVIVKDIEIFSLCEHHLVPFTGKRCSVGGYKFKND